MFIHEFLCFIRSVIEFLKLPNPYLLTKVYSFWKIWIILPRIGIDTLIHLKSLTCERLHEVYS